MHRRNIEAALWHTFILDGTDTVNYYDTLRIVMPARIVRRYAGTGQAWALPPPQEFWD